MRSALALLLVALLGATPFTACASSDSKPSMEHSRGVVIDHAPDDVWVAARSVMMRVGRGGTDINESERLLAAVVDGIPVRVQVQPFGTGQDKTILRVIADREHESVAQDVQDWIVAQLPRW